ncbi:MAG: DUF4326 domain-containing protein [Ferruginibacter sp.]
MTLNIQIVNLKHKETWPANVPVFRIDRTTVLGNPYIIGQDGTRKEVIEKYRLLLPQQYGLLNIIRDSIDAMLERAKTYPILLACWCAPLPCHGDVIRDFILNLDSEHDSLQTKQ